jgi:hypothetical protein
MTLKQDAEGRGVALCLTRGQAQTKGVPDMFASSIPSAAEVQATIGFSAGTFQIYSPEGALIAEAADRRALKAELTARGIVAPLYDRSAARAFATKR